MAKVVDRDHSNTPGWGRRRGILRPLIAIAPPTFKSRGKVTAEAGHASKFSMRSPSTRSNAPTSAVTSVTSAATAWAGISRSFGAIGVPAASSAARIAA